jgi:decaprenylphospho-beta-D-ribofuranose 2-oxidase
VLEALSAPGPGGLIARGAGRSYGDAAQNGDGTVLDMTGLRDEPVLDVSAGEIEVAAGSTFAELLLRLARAGHTLPVVPGTRHLTVGGAVAADIHGKNHRQSGSFGTNLNSLTLCTPARGSVEVSREAEPDLFAATVGGMGLTGVITRAKLRVVPMRSTESSADVDRVDSTRR